MKNIKKYLTKKQYKQQKEEYNKLVANKEISFFSFCTETYKIE